MTRSTFLPCSDLGHVRPRLGAVGRHHAERRAGGIAETQPARSSAEDSRPSFPGKQCDHYPPPNTPFGPRVIATRGVVPDLACLRCAALSGPLPRTPMPGVRTKPSTPPKQARGKPDRTAFGASSRFRAGSAQDPVHPTPPGHLAVGVGWPSASGCRKPRCNRTPPCGGFAAFEVCTS